MYKRQEKEYKYQHLTKENYISVLQYLKYQPWRLRQYVPPKRRYISTSPHVVATHNNYDTFTAISTSDLIRPRQYENEWRSGIHNCGGESNSANVRDALRHYALSHLLHRRNEKRNRAGTPVARDRQCRGCLTSSPKGWPGRTTCSIMNPKRQNQGANCTADARSNSMP
jgi:hypothetical protein